MKKSTLVKFTHKELVGTQWCYIKKGDDYLRILEIVERKENGVVTIKAGDQSSYELNRDSEVYTIEDSDFEANDLSVSYEDGYKTLDETQYMVLK